MFHFIIAGLKVCLGTKSYITNNREERLVENYSQTSLKGLLKRRSKSGCLRKVTP